MRSPAFLFAGSGLLLGALLVAVLPRETLFAPAESHRHDEAGTPGERWACPMMDFIGNRPGDCPVCGMKMTKVTAGELTREQQRRIGVQLSEITEGHAHLTVRAYGTVRYDDRSARVVVPRVSGRVVKRHTAALHVGTDVKAGDPVVDLYSPDAFALQGELAAAVKLGDGPTIEALTRRFESWNLGKVAKAIRDGSAPADTITISSPFAGRIVLGIPGADGMKQEALPQVGQEVMADTALVRVVDPQAYILVIQVPEARAHWLAVGQQVRLASDDRGELADVDASIAWIAPELNQEIRAREVHIHLRDPRGRVLPGSLVSARIESALNDELEAADPNKPQAWGKFTLVPKTAVLSTGVRHVAWRVAERQRDGRIRFELAPLALGPRIEDETGNDVYIVRNGLKPGDEVATQGAFLIDSQAQLAGTASLLFPNGAVAPAEGHQH